MSASADGRADSGADVGRPPADPLRDSVLPGTLPVLPRVELAGCYRGAAPPGGDWFDAFVTDAGLVAGVCGDVAGTGTAAAAACAELSTALRVALLDGADPGSALAALDRHAARRPPTRGASAAVVLLDPADGVLRHAGLGHPPLLLVPAAGPPRWLDGTGSAPLGLGPPRQAPPVFEVLLGPGDGVLACTDGLLRTAGRPLDVGLARLRAAAAGAADMAALVTAAADVRPPRPSDDAALLGIGMRADPVPPVELVSNAIEHAYTGRGGRVPGRVRVTAELDGRGGLRLVVADDGRWRAAGATGRHDGYGLVAVRELSTSLDMRTGAGGTTLTAVCEVRRRAPVATDAPAPAMAPVPPGVRVDPPVVEVSGVVDGTAAAALHVAVLRACGTAGPVVLDLAGVTLLTGAGVRLLHDLVAGPGGPVLGDPLLGDPLLGRPVLRAPDGCPVATALVLAGLERVRPRMSDDTRAEFAEAVNMTAKQLDDWLATDESRAAGQSTGGGESTGHEMGRHIVELLRAKRADLGEDDEKRMRKVVGYVHRHLAQRPDGDVRDTRWRHSLMNWGHDPLK